ncbi:MAG: hypothetical protein H6607_04825 [Flavobacteriales bacterium]|nr:hypothetical protein [Flavobacteriales bacterium]
MNKIGNIYLTWRKSRGDRRIIVGVIRRNQIDGVRFNYIESGVEEAKKKGFTPYEGFPDYRTIYNRNVIEIFGQRIIKTERTDTINFYSFWEVENSNLDDRFYMLAQTQGLLPTDNFEFLAHFRPSKKLNFVTEISGLSHFKLSAGDVNVGDILSYELEPNNEFDPAAVKVLRLGKSIGYIKTIHSRVFYEVKRILNIQVKLIEKNGSINRIFIRIFSDSF